MDSVEYLQLTTLEYARFHKLAVDHQASTLYVEAIQALQRDAPISITAEEHLITIDIPVHIDSIEILSLNKQGAILLAEAREGHQVDIESIISSLVDKRRAKKLHLELPLLRTDHEYDFRAFATWEQANGSLPHEPLDIEMDHGLEWPSRFNNMSSEIVEDLMKTRITVSKETMLYLRATIVDQWTHKDERMAWECALAYKRNIALEHVTPPLLPSTPLAKPYVPSSPACHLPLLSDPPSLLGDDLQAIEDNILNSEKLKAPEEKEAYGHASSDTLEDEQYGRPQDSISRLMRLDDREPFPVQPRVKADDLKVECPLTPRNRSPRYSPSKSVKFNEFVEEIMLLDSRSEASNILSDTHFNDALWAIAEDVNRRSRQEQLQEADSKGRVKVPELDLHLPPAPWKLLQDISHNAEATFAAKMKNLSKIMQDFPIPSTWSGAKQLNKRLSWVPFPTELGKPPLIERFGEDHDLDPFLFEIVNINDSSCLAWKPPGLRILTPRFDDDSDDDEVLEPGYFTDVENQPQNISSLIRKRKMQYDKESLSTADILRDVETKRLAKAPGKTQIDDSSQTILSSSEHVLQPPGKGVFSGKPSQSSSSFLIGGGPFSAGNALDNFLEIRASKKQKPIESSYFAAQNIPKSTHDYGLDKEAKEGQIGQIVQSTEADKTKTQQNALVAPTINPVSGQLQCVVSSTLLNHRTLMRTLQSLLPTLNSISRDFSAHNTTAWLHGSVSRSPVLSPLADEADLIPSPSTAIILTTIAHVRQKPLPGQKTKVALRDRIEKVSIRYEKLLVFVSEGNTSAPETTDGLDEQSTAALADFAGFCAAIETPTLAYFVNGGEANLAKWISSVISQQMTLETSMLAPLMAEETLWELFLRRAGLNAFAAQVVLAEMKAPDQVDVRECQSKAGIFGLTGFVEMGAEEKSRRFGRLLGGTRVLGRVGRVVEMDWGRLFEPNCLPQAV